MAELDAEERAGRKRGGDRKSAKIKVLGHGTLIPREQVKAESRRAPLLDLPERDVDRYGEAARENDRQQVKKGGNRGNQHTGWQSPRPWDFASKAKLAGR